MTDEKQKLPFRIAEAELKRFLDRKSFPILKENLKDNKFNTSVRLEHISIKEEDKELLQIWYSIKVIIDNLDKNKKDDSGITWDQITDIFYG